MLDSHPNQRKFSSTKHQPHHLASVNQPSMASSSSSSSSFITIMGSNSPIDLQRLNEAALAATLASSTTDGPFLTSVQALNLYEQSQQLLIADAATVAVIVHNKLNTAAIAQHERTSEPDPAAATAATLPDTASTVSAPLCRICRGNGDHVALIQCPCKCRGTVGFVHTICLQRWHVVRKAKVCEICHEAYEFDDLLADSGTG